MFVVRQTFENVNLRIAVSGQVSLARTKHNNYCDVISLTRFWECQPEKCCVRPGVSGQDKAQLYNYCDVWLISLTRFWRFLHRSMNAQMASELASLLIGAQTHINNHVVLNLTSCDFVFNLLNHDSESMIVTIWYGAVRCRHRRSWHDGDSRFFAGRHLWGARPPASWDLAMDGLRVVCRIVACRLPASYSYIYNIYIIYSDLKSPHHDL